VSTSRGERVVGAVLGAALGDALGYPVEHLSAAQIRERFGPGGVQAPVLEGGVALTSDETQMAEALLSALVEARRAGAALDHAMRLAAGRFIAWNGSPAAVTDPERRLPAGCDALARGVRWSEAGGVKALSAGSVTRAYTVGLLWPDDVGRAEAWAVAPVPAHAPEPGGARRLRCDGRRRGRPRERRRARAGDRRHERCRDEARSEHGLDDRCGGDRPVTAAGRARSLAGLLCRRGHRRRDLRLRATPGRSAAGPVRGGQRPG